MQINSNKSFSHKLQFNPINVIVSQTDIIDPAITTIATDEFPECKVFIITKPDKKACWLNYRNSTWTDKLSTINLQLRRRYQ